MMKTTMKEDDEKKAQDKEDIQILKDENEQLKQKIAFYEEQLQTLRKCFVGLGSFCTGAQERIDEVLNGGAEDMNVTVGEGRVQWK